MDGNLTLLTVLIWLDCRCIPRSRRYKLDQIPDDSDSESVSDPNNPGISLRKRSQIQAVPVCGVQLISGDNVTVSDLLEVRTSQVPICGVDMARKEETENKRRAAQALLNQRPAWDSSWRKEVALDHDHEIWSSSSSSSAPAVLEDVAGVGVCGIQPVSQRSCSILNSTPTPFPKVFNSCGGRLRGLAASASEFRNTTVFEGKSSILSRLFPSDTLEEDHRGLIKRFDPQGARLFVTGRTHAMNTSWLKDRDILAGRALRCLRVLPHDAYPEMRAMEFPVDDVLNEPLLGYHIDRPENLRGVAAARREQVRAALRFIDDGVRGGEAVLVHCRMGINRSAAVATAYLIIYHGFSCRKALELIEAQGTTQHAVRQPGFTEQLLLLQQEVALQSLVVESPPYPPPTIFAAPPLACLTSLLSSLCNCIQFAQKKFLCKRRECRLSAHSEFDSLGSMVKGASLAQIDKLPCAGSGVSLMPRPAYDGSAG